MAQGSTYTWILCVIIVNLQRKSQSEVQQAFIGDQRIGVTDSGRKPPCVRITG